MWKRKSSVLGHTGFVGLAVGGLLPPILLAQTLLCYFQLSIVQPVPLVTAKSKSKDLSPARGRRPGCTARGLLQRPGKLLEIQTSSLLWVNKLAKLRRCDGPENIA